MPILGWSLTLQIACSAGVHPVKMPHVTKLPERSIYPNSIYFGPKFYLNRTDCKTKVYTIWVHGPRVTRPKYALIYPPQISIQEITVPVLCFCQSGLMLFGTLNHAQAALSGLQEPHRAWVSSDKIHKGRWVATVGISLLRTDTFIIVL